MLAARSLLMRHIKRRGRKWLQVRIAERSSELEVVDTNLRTYVAFTLYKFAVSGAVELRARVSLSKALDSIWNP